MSSRDITWPEFDQLFTTFEHTAFRLEPRESYAGVTYGDDAFSRWLSGEWAGPDSDWSWTRTVRAATATGKRIARVRVVSEPWSDYTKFGMYAARGNIEAGEDIRYLSRLRAAGLGLPVELPGHDYWLFDSRFIVVLHFNDETNDIVRIEVLDDPALVVQHNTWRDAAWHHAAPMDEYIRQVGAPVEPPSIAP